MVRKLALASGALNVLLLSSILFVFTPWFLEIARPLKIEMPTAMMWLIETYHFVTWPANIAFFAVLGIIGWAAFRVYRRQNSGK
ncbi:hypothetical protein EON80_18760 [bacterium]|nr:MAG: hypothetical protein EON80_18760 [bacterium]